MKTFQNAALFVYPRVQIQVLEAPVAMLRRLHGTIFRHPLPQILIDQLQQRSHVIRVGIVHEDFTYELYVPRAPVRVPMRLITWSREQNINEIKFNRTQFFL